MAIRIQCLCVDCLDPSRLAAFWAEALGWRITSVETDQVVLEPPAGSREDGKGHVDNGKVVRGDKGAEGRHDEDRFAVRR